MLPPRMLFVATSNSKLGDTGKQTGLWLEELAVPFMIFRNAGIDVDIASMRGGEAPIDPMSMQGENMTHPLTKEFRTKNDGECMRKLQKTMRLADCDLGMYAGVFFMGGHGTMWDFPNSQDCRKTIETMCNSGRIVSAVCHGPAAFIGVTNGGGKAFFNGKKMCCFTDAEERAFKMENTVPFMLESRIREMGGRFECAEPTKPHAVRDGMLITGQNPASSEQVANMVIDAMREQRVNA